MLRTKEASTIAVGTSIPMTISPRQEASRDSQFGPGVHQIKQGGMCMLKDGPFNQSPGGVSRWVRKLRAFLMFVLGVLVCCAIALAAPAAGGKPAAGQAKDTA